ncbi:MAG: glycine--tRNA ligase subunit beta [Desulfobacteraceae bacterium]|nr:glycine--tRNA ligase subunit beta [Desulfobacteraceae bacterium]
MADFLLEIGTEEIPAGYIQPALESLRDNLLKSLTNARIDYGEARVYGTPRRLALLIDHLADRQLSFTDEIIGPPENVAFDAAGDATVAGLKFAEKMGVTVSKMRIVETEKGRYLCVRRTERGLATSSFMKSVLPGIVVSIPFPKSMRWADFSVSFARPITTIVALLGPKIVHFSMDDRLKSGRFTHGHMFISPKKIKVPEAAAYVSLLRDAAVLVDMDDRRHRVRHQINTAAQEIGGKILPDDELVDIVNNLVEYPTAVAGGFDKVFLELPREILITAMREHQKYFAVTDRQDCLMPCFVAVNNTQARDPGLVARGHERVLRARLSDARFFYRSDLAATMADWVASLKQVMYQAKLGTLHEKVRRVMKNAERIAEQFRPGLVSSASRAAFLCKADLVSQVVGEFPKLQGVMGRIYAQTAGEPDQVARAIEEHYRPIQSGGQLPDTDTGAVVAIADKIDTICGCFSIGMIPTGASDPHALRRQGIGIVQVLLDRHMSFSLHWLIEQGVRRFENLSEQDMTATIQRVHSFFKNRIAHLLGEQGFSKDLISAVVSVSIDDVPGIWRRIQALGKMKSNPEFGPLVGAFKRVANIMKPSDIKPPGRVDESLFEDDSESDLFKALTTVSQSVAEHMKNNKLEEALLDISTLRGEVDAFFVGVKVMADNMEIRKNRIALLQQIVSLFGVFADFSKLSV